MAETYSNLSALFTDIADAIREKTGSTATIVADDFPDAIRERWLDTPYLTFSSPNSFTLRQYQIAKHWNGTLEYSTNASSWSTWDGITTLSSATNGSNNVLYLRGTGNTVITGGSGGNRDYRWILTGTNISCIGNIENLLDYTIVKAGGHPTMTQSCYACLFYGCTSLIKAPALPAPTLTDYCYGRMFDGCTSLIKAPALPATTLAVGCYSSMFYKCTSLTQAPFILPATELADDCYQHMFNGCTSLTYAPTLPATTLKGWCYSNMFKGCTKLKLSSTKTGEYTIPYRIPSSGTGTTAISALRDMFTSTGGTFTEEPSINTTYYLSNINSILS